MNIFRYMMLAKIESHKSEYPQKVGAVIIKGNRIISKGYNQLRHCKTSKSFTDWDISLHAERDACRKVNKDNLKGCYIFVYRELANGDLALAKPCDGCMGIIEKFGIKRVYHTTSEFPFYSEIRL